MKRSTYIPWLSVALGSAFSLALYYLARHGETEQIAAKFERLAEMRVAAVEATIQLKLQALTAAAGLFQASEFVDRAEFHTFATMMLS